MNFDTENFKLRLKRMTPESYKEPRYRLKEVGWVLARLEVKTKDIQNWVNRGFLSPVQPEPKRPKLFSLKNIVQAYVIGYLHKTNSFAIANSVALKVSEFGCKLIEGYDGHDIRVKELSGQFALFYYKIEGESVKGEFLTRQQLARELFMRKNESEMVVLEKRILKAEYLFYQVLVRALTELG